MIFTKNLVFDLTIKDVIGIYLNDEKMNIKNILRDAIEKKCIAGCFILNILDVISYSECEINRDGRPDCGNITVYFTARVIQLYSGDFISNAKIITVEESRQIASFVTEDKLIFGLINYSPLIYVDQLLPIKIAGSKYEYGKDKFIVMGEIFTEFDPIVIKISEYDKDCEDYNLYKFSLDNKELFEKDINKLDNVENSQDLDELQDFIMNSEKSDLYKLIVENRGGIKIDEIKPKPGEYYARRNNYIEPTCEKLIAGDDNYFEVSATTAIFLLKAHYKECMRIFIELVKHYKSNKSYLQILKEHSN